MSSIRLKKSIAKNGVTIYVPGSKSESNRALIINALCSEPGEIKNLASARDTQTMQRLLKQSGDHYDVLDAGTTMRFLTAFLSITRKNTEITGTQRMQQRPIGILVEALRAIGVEIDYMKKDGFPPLHIIGLKNQKTSDIKVSGKTSSQYISALLMIAPALPLGLTIELEDGLVSKPYVEMTLALMDHFGAKVNTSQTGYKIAPQQYIFNPFSVESDWSGVSYWYSFFKLSDLQELKLPGFRRRSFQGDKVIADLMNSFGVETNYQEDGILLTRKNEELPETIDFIDCPDLAQTMAVVCAGIGHRCNFTGLQTLKIKETDRVMALKTELQKIGADFVESEEKWTVIPPEKSISEFEVIRFHTYEDHRMAMAFAPLCLKTSIEFDDSEVVDKSYPTFWEDLLSITAEASK